MKIRIEYSYSNEDNSGFLQTECSDGLGEQILTAAAINKTNLVKNHWSRLLGNYKGRVNYRPFFRNALSYGRLKFKPNYQQRISN